MKNSDFCHLHLHSEFSALDGFGSPKKYAVKARKMGFKYLAITDHSNIDGVIKFQQACLAENIKPILGVEIYMVPGLEKKDRQRAHGLLHIKDNRGFKNVCKMLSYANTENFYYKPRVPYDMLLSHSDGLVISSACMQSFTTKFPGSKQFTEDLIDVVGDDFYFELMPHKMREQQAHNRKMIDMAKRYSKKVFVSNDCHYINRSEWEAQEMLLAIQRKAKWTDENRFKFTIKGLYLKSANEVIASIRDTSNLFSRRWLTNTIEIAEKCSGFKLKQRPVRLPNVPGISQEDEVNVFRRKCLEGFENLFYDGIVRYHKKPYIRNWPVYYERFQEEFALIKSKKFIRYFLIVDDCVQWAKDHDILVGPGRGSVGGCLIAYLLGITQIDPIKHGLLFSRFINEDRIDYPDIDIDFEDSKIYLVRQYLEDTYGNDNVVGVSSFNRLKSRAAVTDVARVFNIPDQEVKKFTKLIDQREEEGIQKTIDESEEAQEFAANHPKVIKLAKKLEGQVRGRSQHAAALVISKTSLSKSNRGNLVRSKDVKLINWEKNDAEFMGLMKLDALSLKLLSTIADTLRQIKANHNREIDLAKEIPLDDKEVLKQINDGYNTGLFQLNTWATSNLIKEMGIEEFGHIAAVAALVRPGPYESGMTANYIKRKHGEQWDRKHEVYEEITKETYGVIVYQEQVMEVINKVGGLPYSTADRIRRIIGKKRDPKEFETYRKEFINGCQKQGMFSEDEAKEFWEGLLKWASYGFPKAHALEYGMIGYWCAWLKYYYPTEFISASLTYSAKDKKKELVEEAYRLGLSLVLPMVNGITDPTNWISKENKIYVPFVEVKGIGRVKAIEAKNLKQRKQALLFDTGTGESVEYEESALTKLLEKIDAFRDAEIIPNPPESFGQYFDFRLTANPSIEYHNLYSKINGLRLKDLDNLLIGHIPTIRKLAKPNEFLQEQKFKGYRSFSRRLLKCTSCELRQECTSPCPPSVGKYNIAIYGQDPGFEEDKEGIGFIGSAGKHLWQSLKGYDRSLFFVSNINKCYPSSSKSSNDSQIDACSQWTNAEIRRVKPIVILALGNNCVKFFKSQKSGINRLSGTTEWSEKHKAWICWCTHPSAVLRNSSNAMVYSDGIKNFKKMIKTIGVKKVV